MTSLNSRNSTNGSKDTLIIIPAYNEERNIGQVLRSLEEIDEHTDILVINDGSRDRTQEILRQQTHTYLSHPINLGYGAALQTAYKYASRKGYRYVVQFDADGQHHLDDLRKLIEEIRLDTDDVIIGSRVLGDPEYRPGIRKSIAFRWFRTMIRLFARQRVTDPTSGLKGFSRRAFAFYADSQDFPSDFPDADTIIHMILRGFKIREIPIRSQHREEGTSMHAGMYRQMVYMLKVTLSILAVVLHDRFLERREQS